MLYIPTLQYTINMPSETFTRHIYFIFYLFYVESLLQKSFMNQSCHPPYSRLHGEQTLIRKRLLLPIRLPCFQTACLYFCPFSAQLEKQSALSVGAQERAAVGAHSRLHGRRGVVIRIGIAARSHSIARRNRIQKRAGR